MKNTYKLMEKSRVLKTAMITCLNRQFRKEVIPKHNKTKQKNTHEKLLSFINAMD